MQCNEPQFKTGDILASRFQVKSLLGRGTFGRVYQVLSGGNPRALKVEPTTGRNLLRLQHEVLQELKDAQGYPKVYSFRKEGELRLLEMELLSCSLDSLGRGSPALAARILERLIKALELLHRRGYLHRDVKPSNVMVSWQQPRRFFLVDFGLCKKFRGEDETHISMREGKGLTGTPHFASLHVTAGLEASRRDDLLSAFYTAASFVGPLPWQSCKDPKQIARVKKQTPKELVCRDLPPQFGWVLGQLQSLQFEEQPDYLSLRDKLLQVASDGSQLWSRK